VVDTGEPMLDTGAPMTARTLVTAALPYANGSIHIGHLVEYLMTDFYVRALRMAGEEALYICADDTHGTPIEVNAQKAGVTPEAFVARFAKEHLEDFEAFGIRFDSFYSTNSEENRKWAYEIYGALQKGGHIERRTIEQLYDESAQRFLPDRFVKGTCPNCGAQDQYGDVCEVCKKTYEPTDLKDPYSVVSGTRPVVKSSEHLFVNLAHFDAFLRQWVSDEGRLQPEIRKFVESWLEGGLRDWCISRDAPYFGFEIPDAPNKYFYVWLDAPIGYISSTENWARGQGTPDLVDAVWRRGEARVVHVIGKDIVYFHTLFWPAMLHAAGLTVPAKVHVHGMLTVDGVKMSKSRGTFVNASTFRKHLDPIYLRYYFASKIGATAEDVDLSLEEFSERVNAHLVNTLANLVSRGAAFLHNKLGGRFGVLREQYHEHLAFARDKVAEAEAAYRRFDSAGAIRAAVEVATLANKLFQDGAPWALIKTDEHATRDLVTLCMNLARTAAVLVAPAVPTFSQTVYRVFGLPEAGPTTFAEGAAFDLVERDMGQPERLVDRMEHKALMQVIEDSKQAAPAATPAPAAGQAAAPLAPPPALAPLAPEISIDDFAKIDLRVGLVVAAAEVVGAKKLLQLTVDLGEEKPRNIFSGIRSAYAPADLVGKKVVVVANLAPRTMRFGVSEGMVLASGSGDKDLQVVLVPDSATPGARVS
jgi:methionyl-tRNA synthetase